MRVTGGVLRGRRLRVPPKGVRPTQDRVREALFAILGDRVCGARFLDLCAGSGAVGLEAWSRGADFVCWVESSRRVFATLEQNVEVCGGDRTRLVLADAARVLRPGFADAPYDLVFADPPYASPRHERNRVARSGGNSAGFVEKVFRALNRTSVMTDRGTLIIEQGSDCLPTERPGWALADERVYGRSRLCFYSKE